MLLPEDLYNRSPGFSALVIQEETTPPLPVGGPTDGLPKLTQQHCVLLAPGYPLILFLTDTGVPALPGGPFRFNISYQSHVETPRPEVHPPH